MEYLDKEDRMTLSLNDGRVIDVTGGLDRLFAYVSEHNDDPGKKMTIDCPICGAKSSMTYVLSPHNNHLHAGCSVCKVSIME